MKVEIDTERTLTAEQNICDLLKQVASAQSTGTLEVTGGSAKWRVFVHLGSLVGIDCSVRSLGQLIYRLRQLGCEEAAKAVKTTAIGSLFGSGKSLIQQEIDRLVAQGALDPKIAIQFSTAVNKEVLESLLWLQEGTYRWQHKELSPTENSLDLATEIDYYEHRLTIWQNYTNIVYSPHQRPYLVQEKLLDKTIIGSALSPKAFRQITQLMQGITLRELSLLLKQDELRVLQILIPYLREQILCLREPSALLQQLPKIPKLNLLRSHISGELFEIDRVETRIDAPKTYKIACIDDSPIVLDELERFLQKNENYLLTKIENPIQASSLIFRLKPDLILMDVTMPNINGYQLCHLFRDSDTFKNTPIIMVTGNRGLIDKARAKMVGATDYLTKPFTEARLLELVGKYLN